MDEDESYRSRRRFLKLTGSASLVGFAGCLGQDDHENPSQREEGWCLEELADESVNEAEATAESVDGVQRNPDDLTSKEEAGYKCGAQGAQLCANCHYFIPSSDSDTIGACAIIDGPIRSQDWCALYEPADRLPERPPMQFGPRSE